jgi:hypothetical protein
MSTQETAALQKLDEELARLPASPTTDHDFDRRAELMAKRVQLDWAIRNAAANSRPQPRGNLEINVPNGSGLTHYYGTGGRVVCARVAGDGRLILDLFQAEFRSLLSGANGLAWQACNPDVLRAGQP